MKHSLLRWGSGLLACVAIAGCGGGGGGSADVPATPQTVSAVIQAAAINSSNDSAVNTSAPFTVLQNAGLSAVTVNSPPVVKFTVFSDGKVVTGLTNTNVRFAIAKLVPGTAGNPDQWVSYVTKSVAGKAGYGPNGSPALASAPQATTDTSTAAQLTYSADGYYTYTFSTDIKSIAGIAYEPSLTHRVAIQLSYKNAAGTTVLANPYYDFTIADGKSVTVTDAAKTRKMTDVASCNSCHEKLALHGGGRIDTQYCVMCHNPGTVDPESGNNLDMAAMTHAIHAGRKIKADAGTDYTIWGYGNAKHDYAEVGFPQDLRNCSKCHSAANTSTPQGDNWKTAVSSKACLTCHTDKVGGAWESKHIVYAKDPAVVGAASSTNTKATDLTNAQCVACHKAGSNISPAVVHWNQNEENSAKYKMNIESASFDATTRNVTVKYYLSDPTNAGKAYDLATGCASATNCSTSTLFGNLRLYLAYQNMVGQTTAVTEFSAYNNGGSVANVYAYKGTNDGSNHYTITIPVPADTATAIAAGTGRVISIGQVKEPMLAVKSLDPRPVVVPTTLLNVVVQNTYKDFVISGNLSPRREIVSSAKCNDCHGALGTTSGSNTLANAFHSGARNTVESCVLCHDSNRASSGNMMTNGLALYESYQFKRMIHGIHGNSKRVSPFTHGNKVVGAFGKDGALTTTGSFFADQFLTINAVSTNVIAAGTVVPVGSTFQSIADLTTAAAKALGSTSTVAAAENYAAEVAYPSVGLNCNACHVNNSYKEDLSTLGTVVMKPTTSAAGVSPVVLETDPNKWKVISPKASTCSACHDSSASIAHVTAFGGSAFGEKTQTQIAGLPRETCNDCHASGGFKGVDIVHGQ